MFVFVFVCIHMMFRTKNANFILHIFYYIYYLLNIYKCHVLLQCIFDKSESLIEISKYLTDMLCDAHKLMYILFFRILFQALRLDNNRLTDINGLLTTQNHLQWLNVSYNLIQWFDYAFVPKSVLWLNMRANAIEELGNYYNMEGFHLVHLDIGQNKLIRIDNQALQPSLREVMFLYVYNLRKCFCKKKLEVVGL